MTRGWGLVWGAVLVGVGTLALLFNLGLVHPEEVERAVALWPLVLMLIGAEIVVSRLAPRKVATVTMTIVVLLVVAGTVGYVVSGPSGATRHESFTAADPGAGPATLRVNLAASTITVRGARLPGAAAQVEIDYGAGPRGAPTLRWDAASRVLAVSRADGALPFGLSTPDSVSLTLNSRLRWRLEFDTGASTITSDLSGLAVDALDVEGGAVSLAARLGVPGGLTHLTVSGGANRVRLSRPAGVPMHVAIDGGVSSLQADGRDLGSRMGELTWSSPLYPAAAAYSATISGGANQVTVTQTG